MTLTLAMLWLLGCGFRRGEVVDCSSLPSATDLDAQDSRALLAGLVPGEARLALRWHQDEEVRHLLTEPTPGDALTNLDGGFAVRVKLACDPEAAMSVHLAPPVDGPRPLTPGVYDFYKMGFDVPDLEQSSDSDATETSGAVIVDEADAGGVTGVLDGHGTTSVKSNFTQEPIGVTVEVLALAFQDVDLLDDNWTEP